MPYMLTLLLETLKQEHDCHAFMNLADQYLRRAGMGHITHCLCFGRVKRMLWYDRK